VVAGGRLVSTGAEKFGASVDPLPAGTVSRRLK
jgi:hypothetical protein